MKCHPEYGKCSFGGDFGEKKCKYSIASFVPRHYGNKVTAGIQKTQVPAIQLAGLMNWPKCEMCKACARWTGSSIRVSFRPPARWWWSPLPDRADGGRGEADRACCSGLQYLYAVVIVGILMIVYAAFGGMKATTMIRSHPKSFLQAVKDHGL